MRAVVVARSRCRIRRWDLSHLPAGERVAALVHQVLAWQPFADAAHAVVWHDGRALVFAWDRSALNDALLDAGLDPTAVRVIAETLLHAPLRQGTRLAECLDGIEGQCWNDGVLTGSRWWRRPPDAVEWENFLRTCAPAVPPSAVSLPEVQAVPLRDGPWAPPRALSPPGGTARLGSAATALAATVLVACTAALAHRWLLVERQLEQARAESQAIDDTLRPALAARERALAQLAQLQLLNARLTAPLPLEVLSHLGEVLPARGVLLKDFDLNGSRLRVGVDAGEAVSRSALIRDLQAGGWFKNVAETKDAGFKGALVLEMAVDGAHPVAARVKSQAAARLEGSLPAVSGPATPRPPQSVAPPPQPTEAPRTEPPRTEPALQPERSEAPREEPPRAQPVRSDAPRNAPAVSDSTRRETVPGVGEARFPLPPAPQPAPDRREDR